ncbi:MAG: shikimate dehydrogenase [Gemmatimonadota bacterium]|nr:shikimate dehydrogenase [Gemmatimonadota bacterium]
MTVTAATRLLVLLGDPVGHSASPDMQNAGFAKAGVDGVYVTLSCGADELAGLVRGIARAGGGGNVTLPHKQRAAGLLDEASEAVWRTGACNTFWGDEKGRVHGDNTDVEGFRRALRSFLSEPIAGRRVLLLGAGGAARAVLLALMREEVEGVTLFNRTPEHARAVARRIGGERARVLDEASNLKGMEFDLVVNATPLGLAPDDPSPIDFGALGTVGAAMDLVYAPQPTAFVRAADRQGVRVTDGLEMLVQQGAVAFERWWNVEAPVDAMRDALDGASGA